MTRAFNWKLDRTANAWATVDPVTGEELDRYAFGEYITEGLPEQGYLALAYGLKQLISDGGAKDKGTTVRARRAAMANRYANWCAGTYAFRDGTGTGSMPDGDIFRALVALGRTPDTVDQRDKWKKLPAAKRRAIGNIAEIREWLESNTIDVDADAALEEFNAAA